MLEKNGRKIPGRLAQPFRDLEKRGITRENWLDNLDQMTDSEITVMLNLRPDKKILDESRKASPSISDRNRAEAMKYFGV